MLPAKHRLKRKRDFATVYKAGKTLRTAFFRIHTRPNQLPFSRIGFVLPNKTVKSAVKRNRKKRQVREFVRLVLPRLIGGYDIIISIGPAAVDADPKALYDDLQTGLTKIQFLTK